MSRTRMAITSLLCIAMWTGLVITASVATPALPNEIAGLVPSCALDCFQSFVSSNYGASGCGISPSLSCLCQVTGASGFTLGEGAVQCLVVEINRRSCLGDDASQKAVTKAYAVCSGFQNAAPETHATIVATLVVPSGTGPVQVPTGASTGAALGPTSLQDPASNAATTTALKETSTTATIGSTAASTPAGIGSDPSSAPTGISSHGPALNTAQIVGISVGIGATLAFAVGLIFLARCVRKRNIGDQESVLTRPKRESKDFGILKSSQDSPRNLQISAPIHEAPADMEFRRPGGSQRPMVARTGAIGLALSPPRIASATAHDNRLRESLGIRHPLEPYTPYRPSVDGPTRQALTLTIPQNAEELYRDVRTFQSSRDSVVTEFQEDGEAEGSRGSNIWRLPPTDPQSTTTYYVADRWGNWTLRDRGSSAAEPPSASNGTVFERGMDAAARRPADWEMSNSRGDQVSKPAPAPAPAPERVPVSRLESPTYSKMEEQGPRSSSFYPTISTSGRVKTASASPPPSDLPPAASLIPAQLSTVGLMKGQYQSNRRRSQHGNTRHGRGSRDLVGTMPSTAADDNDGGLITEWDAQDGLSPVMESPRIPARWPTSAVTFPTSPPAARPTPERRVQQRQKQLPTPPRGLQTALTLLPRTASTEPVNPTISDLPGQSSPTLGMADVAPLKVQRKPPAGQFFPSTAKQYLIRAPGSNPNPLWNPAQVKSGSPELRSGSAPPQSQRLQRRPSSVHQRQAYEQHHRRGSSSQLRLPYQDSTQSDVYPARGLDNSRSSLSHVQLGPTGLPDRVLSPRASAATSGSVDSAGSSFLLTKRLGADRAAALTLSEDFGGQSARRVKWQRDHGGPGFTAQDTAAALPSTPGWLPKLTPTRRGDDLFLNVQ